MKPFQRIQLDFIDYLRNPNTDAQNSEQMAEPKDRQKEIYRELVYKTINQCIAESFPITKNIIEENNWKTMIKDFISCHRLQTPYFLEICQEFLVYLMHTRIPLTTDHPFMLELAHFEWIQLALDISDINFPEYKNHSTPTEHSLWKASPLVVCLTYSYPVHIIDECYLPQEHTAQPSYLLVYRNRNDDIKILATDSLSLRIIQLLQAMENITYLQIRQLLSTELDEQQPEIILARILPILCVLAENEVVFFE